MRNIVRSRIRTYPGSPRRFVPLTASAQDLATYGYPRRPDPEKEPLLAATWNRVFAKPIRMVRASLATDRVMSSRVRLPRDVDTFSGARWAGAIKVLSRSSGSDYGRPAKMVFGEIELPTVLPVTPSRKPIAVAFWVGLDGHSALAEPASRQVLQAGVAAQVNPPGRWPWSSTTLKWWPWTEWYTELHKDPAVAVRNFPVAAGNRIFVVVCAPEPDFGFVSMLNLSRGIGVSVGFQAPPGIQAHGHSAEWIVEAPSQSPYVPIFTPVTFTDCTAGSLEDGVFNLDNARLSDIRTHPSSGSPYGSVLVEASAIQPETTVVRQLAHDWF